VGKTMLAIALGLKAVHAGYRVPPERILVGILN